MRLIDADTYRDILVGWLDGCYKKMLSGYDDCGNDAEVIASCIMELDEQPTVELVKHGHWEWFYNEPIDVNGHMCYSYGYRCSVCHEGGTCWIGAKLSESEAEYWKHIEPVDHKYCPDCGTKMYEIG